jgi:hypothetical protein
MYDNDNTKYGENVYFTYVQPGMSDDMEGITAYWMNGVRQRQCTRQRCCRGSYLPTCLPGVPVLHRMHLAAVAAARHGPTAH